MGRLVEEIRVLSIELGDDRTFNVVIEERLQLDLRPTADIMHMGKFRKGDIRLTSAGNHRPEAGGGGVK